MAVKAINSTLNVAKHNNLKEQNQQKHQQTSFTGSFNPVVTLMDAIDSYSLLFLNSLINCLLRTSLESGQRRLPEPPESKIIFIAFSPSSILTLSESYSGFFNFSAASI